MREPPNALLRPSHEKKKNPCSMSAQKYDHKTSDPTFGVHVCRMLQCNDMTIKSQKHSVLFSSQGPLQRIIYILIATEECHIAWVTHQAAAIASSQTLGQYNRSQSTSQDTINKTRSHIKRLKPINVSS